LESETILTPLEQAAIEEAVADTATNDLPEVLDLLPLRDAVVFPMLVAPISVSRPKYISEHPIPKTQAWMTSTPSAWR
jgi:ATP-dependent Lon protease